MRWFWIDHFTEFVSGQRAAAVKCVTLSEEAVDEYAPGRTYLPAPLIIEGIAQAGGLLLGQLSDFTDRIVLAKVASAAFHFEAFPGDSLTYQVEIMNRDPMGAVVQATSEIAGRRQADVSLMFAALQNDRFGQVELFEPAQFCRMLRLLRLFEVGVNPDGSPVKVPDHMIQAEKDYLRIG